MGLKPTPEYELLRPNLSCDTVALARLVPADHQCPAAYCRALLACDLSTVNLPTMSAAAIFLMDHGICRDQALFLRAG